MRRIRESAKWAEKAVGLDDVDAASAEWRKVFGEFWPDNHAIKASWSNKRKQSSQGSQPLPRLVELLGSNRPDPYEVNRQSTTAGPDVKHQALPSGREAAANDADRRNGQAVSRNVEAHRAQPAGILGRGPSTDPRFSDDIVRVDYQKGEIPKIFVLKPQLVPEAQHLHRYEDGSLCLYWPG